MNDMGRILKWRMQKSESGSQNNFCPLHSDFCVLTSALGMSASAAGALDLVADVGEGVAGVGAQGSDGRDAHHDDQGQHDGMLDRGRAVFVLQETYQCLAEVTHLTKPLWNLLGVATRTRYTVPLWTASSRPGSHEVVPDSAACGLALSG